jgi:hypothetical protein
VEKASWGWERNGYLQHLAPFISLRCCSDCKHVRTRQTDVPPHSCPVPPHSCPVPPHSCPVPPHSCPVPPHSCPVPPHSCPVPPHSCPVPPHSCPVPPHSWPIPPYSCPIQFHHAAVQSHHTATQSHYRAVPSKAQLLSPCSRLSSLINCIPARSHHICPVQHVWKLPIPTAQFHQPIRTTLCSQHLALLSCCPPPPHHDKQHPPPSRFQIPAVRKKGAQPDPGM